MHLHLQLLICRRALDTPVGLCSLRAWTASSPQEALAAPLCPGPASRFPSFFPPLFFFLSSVPLRRALPSHPAVTFFSPLSVWEIVGQQGGGLSVLRTFRLMRVLKLVRFMPALQRQLVVLMKTMDNVATFCMLLMLFIFIFRWVLGERRGSLVP